MKFGKQLQKRQLDIPEYAARFVNYKALKKLIKQLSTTPPIPPQNASIDTSDPQATLQANRAAFFFRLERELEKVNAFYLQKEAELQLRLKTLLDKKRTLKSRNAGTSKLSATFITLEEGFQQFCNDLNKLQQFVDINNTAFSKILKKWDKTSKSRTKELYLSRAVEVQPCFNRDIISDLSDQATTSLQELGAWAEGDNVRFEATRTAGQVSSGQPIGTDNDDTDTQVLQATTMGNTAALQDWLNRLQASPDASKRFTKVFLLAIAESPSSSLAMLFESGLVDAQAVDEITERNCLHEAAISGNEPILQMGISEGVGVANIDVYGRNPLHYACIFGRVQMVRILCSRDPSLLDSTDNDNFTPLIQAIAHGQLACVQELLAHGVRLDPEKESDHIPLNLACQYGSISIARLLLQKGAKLLADAEGFYPQHLVARSGEIPEALVLLEQYGADLDQRDRLYQWTPLFHAASDGRVDCLRLLLQKGADRTIQDEKGYFAIYYATWEGNMDCMEILGFESAGLKKPRRLQLSQALSTSVDQSAPPPSTTGDGIPDLSLPPPIIPLRRYGHNFLDSKTLIQISFQSSEPDAIIFYHDSKYPAARLTISSKSSDVIPRNIMLPIQEDTRTVSFQVDDLKYFSLDLDIYPTFGSKMIARSVALPTLFGAVEHSSGRCCLPMFDPRLRAIGQISFEYQVIKPFEGMALDIANFATYWRTTSQLDTHPNGLITGSSLSGNYVQIFVQLTKDGVPVLYPRWSIDYYDIRLPISKLTYQECCSLLVPSGYATPAESLSTQLESLSDVEPADIHQILSSSFVSLRDALHLLASDVHINITALFPTAMQERAHNLEPSRNVNEFVDAILLEVFDDARSTKEQLPDFVRSVVFSSYNADICIALNWKQPNYAVLLCNDLGVPSASSTLHSDKSDGHGSFSVKEAVRVAQTNNFMGLVCRSQLLVMVPSLIESIKMAGLVLVMDASDSREVSDGATRNYQMPEGVDGILKNSGVLKFNEMVDV